MSMRVDIWSDIRCPFCYIGKRKFEKALESFSNKDSIEIVWHSFQLDPGLKTQPGLHTYDYLAQIKGMSRDQVVQMHDHVKQSAEEVGLTFDFDRAVVANSFHAHRLLQLARLHNRADAAEEHLFRAHFTEGKNIDDIPTLKKIGLAIGLEEAEVSETLSSQRFADKVQEDEIMARHIGIRGVPFFLFNNRFAVSGAQPPEVFLQTLEKAWADARQES